MKPKVILHFNTTILHSHHIYCGLEILKKEGLIDLEYKYALHSIRFNLTLVEVDGLKILFDLQDNPKIEMEPYANCDFYVKRMLLVSGAQELYKLIPFGLNYGVFSSNAFMRKVFLKNMKLLPFSIRYYRTLSKLLNMNIGLYNCDYRKFSNASNDNGKIIFSTRLWNPERGNEDWKKEERHAINNERITLVRNFKQRFGNRFFGGIFKDELSMKSCPDLILDKKMTDKKHYLKTLKSFEIGVCNKGLEDSIGWKFAEYLCDSLAIVSNPVDKYVHHGNLQKDVHFLEFRNDDECLSQVQKLFDDVSLRREISANNKKYYEDYLHPSAKFKEIFRLIGKELPQTK